ncbi:MAG: hypothetical protein ACKORL_00990, partial [Phycisphaerales bacterium]
MPKLPRILVYSLMIAGCLALIPPLVFARMRAVPSPNRPIHILRCGSGGSGSAPRACARRRAA